MPDPHSRDVGKKAASHWVEVAGGAGVDKTTHSPPFFPGRSLGRRRRRRRGRRGRGKGGEEEEEDLGRLCKTRPDKDCPINTRVPARTRLFQPLSLLLLLLQATPSPAKTLGRHFSFSPIFLGTKLVAIVGRQTPHWLRTSPPLVTSWSGPDASTTKAEMTRHRHDLRSPLPHWPFLTPQLPLFFHLCGKSAPGSSQQHREASLAEKSGNFSCYWPPTLFPGHCRALSGGLSPAIVARSRQDSSTCTAPILPTIGKFSLIKTAPVCNCDLDQGWPDPELKERSRWTLVGRRSAATEQGGRGRRCGEPL